MICSRVELSEYLQADKIALGRRRRRPKYNDLIWRYEILLRKCEYYNNCKGRLSIPGLIYKYMRFRIGVKCGLYIPLNTCGKGLCIAYAGNIIISNYAKIGNYCRIHAGVNIGADAKRGKSAPQIGDFVYIAPGAKLFGDIKIGNNIAIGANAVVNKSFMPLSGGTIVGVPAKLISNDGTEDIIKLGDRKALL